MGSSGDHTIQPPTSTAWVLLNRGRSGNVSPFCPCAIFTIFNVAVSLSLIFGTFVNGVWKLTSGLTKIAAKFGKIGEESRILIYL